MGTRRSDHSTGCTSDSLAVADHDLTAQEDIAHRKAEFLAVERSVALARAHEGWADLRPAGGVHDDQVGIESRDDRAFGLLEAGERRRAFAHPARCERLIAQPPGELEAAQVQGLHAWTSGRRLRE